MLNMVTGVDVEYEGSIGITAPVMFALAAQAHMKKYGTTHEQMAQVAVKNHTHAVNNPYAHFPKKCTVEDIFKAKTITTPFTLMECSPISDGAAGVILASEERARELSDDPVFILGTGQVAANYNICNADEDYASWPALKLAGQNAYAMAGIGPKDIDVAEVHDCFSFSEIMNIEELGFAPKGEGGPFVAEGRTDYGGDVVVNPRGGLIGCGHPLGATGVAQCVELYRQLRGEAGPRQVSGAKIGLGHNLSGLAEHHVIIYGRGDL